MSMMYGLCSVSMQGRWKGHKQDEQEGSSVGRQRAVMVKSRGAEQPLEQKLLSSSESCIQDSGAEVLRGAIQALIMEDPVHCPQCLLPTQRAKCHEWESIILEQTFPVLCRQVLFSRMME